MPYKNDSEFCARIFFLGHLCTSFRVQVLQIFSDVKCIGNFQIRQPNKIPKQRDSSILMSSDNFHIRLAEKDCMHSPNELEAQLYSVGTRAKEMLSSQPAEAVRLCTAVIDKAAQIEEPTRALKNQVGRVKLILSSLHLQLSGFDKSLETALDALDIYTEIDLQSGVARSLNAIGLADIYMGAFDEGLENLLQSLAAADKLEDQRLKIEVLNNLGLLYLRMEDYARARDYLTHALEISVEIKTAPPDTNLLENISAAYFQLGEYKQALKYARQSIQTAQADQGQHSEAIATNMTGRIYYAMGHPSEAQDYYQKALKLSKAIGYSSGAANSLFLIGKLAYEQKDLKQAEEHLQKALKEATQAKEEKLLYQIHELLAAIYEVQGDFQNALTHFQVFHETKEEIFSEDMTTKIKSLEIIHRVRESQRDREIYRLENVTLMEEIKEKNLAQAKLEKIVSLDPLTGLYNRRHFFDITQKEIDRCRRYSRPVSIIMLDIDHFKTVNDQFGHLVGDRVIKETSRRIQKTLRRVDSACRFGGEEFAILLPETPLAQATMVAERVCRLISHKPTISSELKISITASVGVASYEPDEILSVDTLLDRADQAMYYAKRNGRNQVKFYTPDLNGQFENQ